MEFISELMGVGLSAASGGIFGLFGAVVGQVSKYFQEKQRQAFQREKWNYELDLQKLQMAAAAAETEQEIALANTAGSWAGMQASIQAESVLRASPWANNIRSLFRPFLTLLLLGLVAWIFRTLLVEINSGTGILASLFNDDEMRGMLRYIVQSITFSAATAALWWFAERALTPSWAKK